MIIIEHHKTCNKDESKSRYFNPNICRIVHIGCFDKGLIIFHTIEFNSEFRANYTNPYTERDQMSY